MSELIASALTFIKDCFLLILFFDMFFFGIQVFEYHSIKQNVDVLIAKGELPSDNQLFNAKFTLISENDMEVVYQLEQPVYTFLLHIGWHQEDGLVIDRTYEVQSIN